MITTLTLNPALDKTIKIPELNYGKVNRVGAFREDLGGKGINAGRITGGFGITTRNVALLGEDNSHEVLSYFEKDGMEVLAHVVPGHTRTNIKVVELVKDITTDINEEGIYIDQVNQEALMALLDDAVKYSDYLIMGGSLAKGMPVDTYGKIAARYKEQCHVVIDADDEVLLEGLKGSPFLIKPNIHELEDALDRNLTDNASIVEAGREIIATYGVVYVLVSMGAEGSLLVTEHSAYRGGTVPTTIVSTVGAGDSMLAGFVYGLVQHHAPEDCLAIGTACSTVTISKDGYPKLDLEEVLAIADKVRIERL